MRPSSCHWRGLRLSSGLRGHVQYFGQIPRRGHGSGDPLRLSGPGGRHRQNRASADLVGADHRVGEPGFGTAVGEGVGLGVAPPVAGQPRRGGVDPPFDRQQPPAGPQDTPSLDQGPGRRRPNGARTKRPQRGGGPVGQRQRLGRSPQTQVQRPRPGPGEPTAATRRITRAGSTPVTWAPRRPARRAAEPGPAAHVHEAVVCGEPDQVDGQLRHRRRDRRACSWRPPAPGCPGETGMTRVVVGDGVMGWRARSMGDLLCRRVRWRVRAAGMVGATLLPP